MKKFDISELVVSKLVDVYSYTLEEDTEAKALTEHSVLILKRRGQSFYTVSGKRYVADPNHIVYFPAGTSYELSVDRVGECTILEFDVLNGDISECREFFIGNESDILTTAKNMLHYWNLRGPAYGSKCLSELYSLLTQISTIESYADSLVGKYGFIHKSVKYIEKNYNKQDLYTPMLAKMSGIGETYYRNIFQAVFGVPPTKYIQQYRVEKAKKLLVDSAGSVEEIALAVGFANSSYFCKVFKTTTGLTPSEFAEKGRWLG
ncbi:MAG: helix-turn-helix transcriptional regulator [Clostridia bacterium]|nr:helix-turn-helix transcriptional regulator [Clostridia bacterium]